MTSSQGRQAKPEEYKKIIEGYTIEASNKQLTDLLKSRISQTNIHNSRFDELAYSAFPYFFQEQERKNFIAHAQNKLFGKVIRHKYHQFIIIKKVQSFEHQELTDYWVVDSKRMAIVGNRNTEPSPQEFEDIIKCYFENPQRYPKPMKDLYFGRSVGLGKVIHFQAHDVSRTHFKIKNCTVRDLKNQQRLYTLLNLKKVLRFSNWVVLPSILSQTILDYVLDKYQTPYEIEDLKSSKGTFLNIGRNIELTTFTKNIILTDKGEMRLTVQGVLEQKIDNQECFLSYNSEINKIADTFKNDAMDHLPSHKPEYWKEYDQVINKLDKNSKNQKILSTLVFSIESETQVRYIFLNNCMKSYTMANGLGEINVQNPYCEAKKELLRIYYEEGKWMAEGSQSGLEIQVKKEKASYINQNSMVRMGKSTKVLIDIPKSY